LQSFRAQRTEDGCCALPTRGHATAAPPSAATNLRLAMLIAIGPSNGDRAHWIIANDNTP